METVVTFEDFLKTYSLENQKTTKFYLQVMKLARKGIPREKINKILNIPGFCTYNWLVRKQIPIPIKAVEALKKFGLGLPLYTTRNDQFKLFLKTSAFIFGDGTLTPKFCTYLSGDKSDLKEIKKEFQNVFKLSGKIRKIQSRKIIISGRVTSGISYILAIQGRDNQILGRLFHTTGTPIGDKVIKPFLVPNWIMKGPKWMKKIFLEVLLGNELETPRLRKDYGCHFDNVRFRMMKVKEHIFLHKKFLNQIRQLLSEFGIETSHIRLPTIKTKRKDGRVSYDLYFAISKNKLNIYRFHKTFKLRYASRKQKIFDKTIDIIKENLENELENINLCVRAFQLRKTGLGTTRISKILDIPDSTVDSWFNTSRKPYHFERKIELERMLNS